MRPGFDPITQAESGFMSLNGFPDGEPVRTGPPIVDMVTGMSACNAILLALIARDRLGRGQQVEVALIDTAVAMTGFYGMAYLISGENPGRFGNSPNGSPTVGVYEASDGPLYMACANDRLYRRLVIDVLDRPDLVTDPNSPTGRSRTANKEKLRAIIAGIFVQRQPRKLDGEDEEGQHSGRLSAHRRRRLSTRRKCATAIASARSRIRPRAPCPTSKRRSIMSLTPIIDPVAAPLARRAYQGSAAQDPRLRRCAHRRAGRGGGFWRWWRRSKRAPDGPRGLVGSGDEAKIRADHSRAGPCMAPRTKPGRRSAVPAPIWRGLAADGGFRPSVRLAARVVISAYFNFVGFGPVNFQACHPEYQRSRCQAETLGLLRRCIDLRAKPSRLPGYVIPVPHLRCEMKDPTFVAELQKRLGAPSSETVESLRLLKAFLKLAPGQRFEIIELVERLAADPDGSDPRIVLIPHRILRTTC